MPNSTARPFGQRFLPGLGLVPSVTAELEAYDAIPPGDNVRAQALAKHILEGDLSSATVPKKALMLTSDDVLGELNIRPVKGATLKQVDVVAALRKIASRDKLRPHLTGVFADVDLKQLVATDGHSMVVLPDATLTGKKRILAPKDGAVIDERYPDYQNVIPLANPYKATVADLDELRAKLTGIARANRFINSPIGIRAEFSFGERFYYFEPNLLLRAVVAMQSTGSTALTLEFAASNARALLLRDSINPKKLALAMPVMAQNTSDMGRAQYNIAFCPVLAFEENPAHDDFSDVDWSKVKPKGKSKALKAIVGNANKIISAVPAKKKPTKTANPSKKKPAKPKTAAGIKFIQVEGDQFMTEDKRWSYTDPSGSHHPHNKFEVAIHNSKTFLVVELTETEQQAKDFIAEHFKKTYKQFLDLKVSTGTSKAKTPRAKKAKPADTRAEVAHFDAELTFFRQFVALTEKPVTLTQVRNLHRKLEKAIASRKVRKASPNAALLDRVANIVASAYEKMTKGNIATVGKLELPTEAVTQARALATGSKVSNAVRLLSEFINLQGQQPDAKRVAGLLKSLEKEHADHGSSPYALAVGAAVATLRDWQPGKAVDISTQQLGRLSGLSGLGCACQDAAAKSVPLAGAPAARRATAPARAALGNVDSIFTPIGQKDHRQASGNVMRLPGDLGKFLGNIEDHEYALAIRGEKGAGKTRFLYQLKNLFAGMGKRVASFSLEIGKNSDVVSRHMESYIAPANRARVMIASEATGLDTIRQAAKAFDVVAIDSWGKIPGVMPGDFDKIRKEFPNTLFLVIFQSTTAGTSRGGSSSEYDASAVCQVNLPGVAVMEKNRYATGAADELRYLVNEQRLAQPGE